MVSGKGEKVKRFEFLDELTQHNEVKILQIYTVNCNLLSRQMISTCAMESGG